MLHMNVDGVGRLNRCLTKRCIQPGVMGWSLLWLIAVFSLLPSMGQAATAPVAQSMSFSVVKNFNPFSARERYAAIYAPVTSATTMQIVTPPAHGTVGLRPSCTFVYKPTAGYVGPDSFTYKVNDGISDSNVATCSILVREPGDRAGQLVLLVVNNLMLPQIQTEVNRLQADLIAEGYSSRIITETGAMSTANALKMWTDIRTEFLKPNQNMAGAILIGRLPYATGENAVGTMTDCALMNLRTMGDTTTDDELQPYNYHIWVSRISTGSLNAVSLFGDDAALIKRYLQANHDYRTGASRYPHTAYYENIFSGSADMNTLLDLVPRVEFKRPEVGFVQGGELIHETSHGNTDGYSDGEVTTYTIHEMIAQCRFALNVSCSSGGLGGVVNNQLFTRGGGNIMSVGASISTTGGAFDICTNSNHIAVMHGMLAGGESWGTAYKTNLPTYAATRVLVCYGDMSVGLSRFPENQMPTVTLLTASQVSGPAPLTVNFAATASDSDGTIANIEWFPTGHLYGKVEPTVAGPTVTTCSYTYTTPHRYLARVEVVDNYMARAWKTVEINVPLPAGQPVRINCGRTTVDGNPRHESVYGYPAYDFVDSTGKVWLHDQPFAAGYWGWDGHWTSINDYWKTSAVSNATVVLGTTEQALFQHMRTFNEPTNKTTYRIPVANGGYTVNVGMADVLSTAAGQRLLNTWVEGAVGQTAFDAYQSFGAKTAGVASTHVTVADGELTLDFSRNAASTTNANPGIAYIEVIPDSGGGGGGETAPFVTTNPASVTVIAGQTATFSVVAGGTATLAYQWQKNGVNVAGATSATYTTPITTTANSGAIYRVVISNAFGTATSSAATLTVNAAPVGVLSLSSSAVTVVEGNSGSGTVSFTVSRTSGSSGAITV
ncbi:MAG: Ig-like domain-containing protein, partial [Planctomycetota bacterium]